jgi:hypothetical protein
MDVKVSALADHPHAALLHRAQVVATRDQRDIGAAFRQGSADVGPDCPGADHREAHKNRYSSFETESWHPSG